VTRTNSGIAVERSNYVWSFIPIFVDLKVAYHKVDMLRSMVVASIAKPYAAARHQFLFQP
jgi:hypothetical protein